MIPPDAPGPALPGLAATPARPGDQDLTEIMTRPPRPGVLAALAAPPDRYGYPAIGGWRGVHERRPASLPVRSRLSGNTRYNSGSNPAEARLARARPRPL